MERPPRRDNSLCRNILGNIRSEKSGERLPHPWLTKQSQIAKAFTQRFRQLSATDFPANLFMNCIIVLLVRLCHNRSEHSAKIITRGFVEVYPHETTERCRDMVWNPPLQLPSCRIAAKGTGQWLFWLWSSMWEWYTVRIILATVRGHE
jgi:hypothetical protein